MGTEPVSRYKDSRGALECPWIIPLNKTSSAFSSTSISESTIPCQASELKRTAFKNKACLNSIPASTLQCPRGNLYKIARIFAIAQYPLPALDPIVGFKIPIWSSLSPRYVFGFDACIVFVWTFKSLHLFSFFQCAHCDTFCLIMSVFPALWTCLWCYSVF